MVAEGSVVGEVDLEHRPVAKHLQRHPGRGPGLPQSIGQPAAQCVQPVVDPCLPQHPERRSPAAQATGLPVRVPLRKQ